MSEVAALLLAQIVDCPDDLYLRQIYADHLLDLGDARGELISLQLAHRDPDRVASLIATYGRSWIGPLESWVRFPPTFGEGFLAEVTFVDPARDLSPLIGDPIWATVRAIHLGRISRVRGGPSRILRSVARLIADPVMRSLVSVTVDDNEGLMIERDRDGVLTFVPRFR